jgi:putative cell wall-binding protein
MTSSTPLSTKRRIAVTTALTLGMTAAAMGGTASATQSATIEPLAGADRYGTARELAMETFDEATTVFVASGTKFPDALAAAGLAGSHVGPILLVQSDGIPPATRTTLTELGAENVVILGGTDAVSDAVEAELAAEYAVTRIAGTDRYRTAVAIAEAIEARDGLGAFEGRRAAFLARGNEFADVLSTGAMSYFASVPVLLTQTDSLTPATSTAIDDLGIETIIVAGGTDAVSQAVVDAIEAKGATVRRLAGTDRQETSVVMAEFGVQEFGLLAEHANISRGDAFPDALAGGAHAGDLEMSPIILTAGDTLGAPAEDWIESHCDTIETLHVFGGTEAVPASVSAAALQAARSC